MRNMKLLVMVVCLGLVGVVQGQEVISVTASSSVIGPRLGSFAAGAQLVIETNSWSLAGGNGVVVLFAAEGATDMTATFGGQEMNVVGTTNNNFYAGVAYLIKPAASTGDISLSITAFGGQRISYAYSVLSLAGVGEVAGSDTRTSNGTLGYTTTLDGGHVVGVAINNNWQGPAPTVTGRPNQILVSQAVDANCSILQAHGAIPTAGAYTDSYSGLSAAATVAFDPKGPPAGTVIVVK